MKRTGKIIIYAAFTLLMVIVFLIYRFPSDMAQQLMDEQLAQVDRNLEVTTGSVTPTFPPGIQLKPLSVSYAGVNVLNADQFRIKPDLLTLLGAHKAVTFSGAIGNGHIKGSADMTTEANRPHIKVAFNLIAVPLEALELARQWPDYRPLGDINAYVDFDNRKGAGGTTKVNLDIVPMKVVLDPPIMGLEQVEFSQLKAEISITRRMLQIRRCEADGQQFEGKVSGSIMFREPLENSRLTLACTLRPQPAFVADHRNDILGGLLSSSNTLKRGMVFRISGTLGNPQYVIR